MSPPTVAALDLPCLRSSGDSPRLRGLEKRAGVTVEWLTVQQAAAMIQAAGYPDSVATIRRRIDAGRFGEQGEDWYRSESGYRFVRPAAVEAFIRRRKDAQA